METIAHIVAFALLAAAAVGVVLTIVQLVVLRRHGRRQLPATNSRPPISILKPLCGMDDDLAINLRLFAQLPYPRYEVLLGLRDDRDPAYPLAFMLERRYPSRFRIVFQDRTAGLNPKVNQLIGMAAAARFDLMVISDSNTRVPAGYLHEIADLMSDPTVGLVAHPIAGAGESQAEACLGSILDNLHITGTITPGFLAAKHLCNKDYVVGKSMAMRRSDLGALGGFRVVKDVLAEDFVLGRLIPEKLGKRVVMARSVVESISVRRSLGDFVHRYARWSVMQRQCAGLSAYLGLLLMNPIVLASAAILMHPSAMTGLFWLGTVLARTFAHAVAGQQLRARPFSAATLAFVPLKELLAGAAWAYGLCSRTIEWRSNRLIVLRGSALAPVSRRRHRNFPESGTARTSAAA